MTEVSVSSDCNWFNISKFILISPPSVLNKSTVTLKEIKWNSYVWVCVCVCVGGALWGSVILISLFHCCPQINMQGSWRKRILTLFIQAMLEIHLYLALFLSLALSRAQLYSLSSHISPLSLYGHLYPFHVFADILLSISHNCVCHYADI